MRIAAFVNGILAGLLTLVIGGSVVAGELMANRAQSWLPSILGVEPASLTPWWFLLTTGLVLIVAASMAFERPLFSLAGFAIAAATALIATGAGAS